MTESVTTIKAKRITLADANSAFHNRTNFVAGNGTLVGVTGPVAHSGLSGADARLYAHHVRSQSYMVLYTVVSKGTVIGWSYSTAGSIAVPQFIVIGSHNGNAVIKP